MKPSAITVLLVCASSTFAHPIQKRTASPQGPLLIPEAAIAADVALPIVADVALPIAANVAADVGLPIAEKVAGKIAGETATTAAGGGLKALGSKVVGKLGRLGETLFPLAGMGLMSHAGGEESPPPEASQPTEDVQSGQEVQAGEEVAPSDVQGDENVEESQGAKSEDEVQQGEAAQVSAGEEKQKEDKDDNKEHKKHKEDDD